MSVFFYGCITMDGYLADKNHNLNWFYQTGAIEETDYESFFKNIDITIMGKRTLMKLASSGIFFNVSRHVEAVVLLTK